MLEAYVSAGLPPGRFWKITPRLYLHEMKGAAARLDREYQDRAWLAWHAAYLPSFKRKPSLAQLQGTTKKPAKVKPWQAQLAAWQAYAQQRKRA